MATPVVAIVGRPNVGKSTLFNRLVQRRHAIVDEQEGITRDRIYGKVEWTGHTFTIVDTGGFIPQIDDVIDAAVRQQVELAIDEADYILFIVDGREGIVTSDSFLADLVRKSGKPHVMVVNKIDNNDQELLQHEFHELGIDPVVTLSALGGRRVGDLLDMVVESLGDKLKEEKQEEGVRIAIVGVPNAGKSSIANRLLGREKSIVTEIPGTTRDAIDSRLRYHGEMYILVDTAGLRKKAKVSENIEYYSTLRTHRAIESSHIVLVVVDAMRGFSKQDQHIVREVMDKGRGLILLVNKWDLIQKETGTHETFKKEIKRLFKSLEDYPILFISAETNQRISKIIPEVKSVYQRWSDRIPTGIINQVVREATDSYQPPATKGKSVKIKYATQVSVSPPHFAFFGNFPDLIPVSYRNYLENRLRQALELNGVPVRLSFRRS
ncbi:MAG: ribosome biogenesis GTPase Der [Candidatus Marinimicrobia bacterium]|nr:ribosome biogenesis GTPase Der [Candidatus Neomarinimicrobiota bacterium]